MLARGYLALFFTFASGAPSVKRGFVGDGCKAGWTNCTQAELLSNVAWHYSYNPDDPYYMTTHDASNFVPMHWCISTLNATVPSYVDTSYMMGFNEPNNLHNCNKDAAVVAAAWAVVMQKWPSSKLVSPATAGDGIPWLDAFFGNCSALYGSKGCNIYAVAVHDYTCDAKTLISYLESVHSRYGKPVWLTEWSCGDGAQGKPESDHLKYMKAAVPLLDAASFVERYAWMSASSPNRGLVAGGKLTAVGELYNSL